MHRRPLLEMLARYREAFPAEGAVVDRICARRSASRLFRPHVPTWPHHGRRWIVSPDRRRCLLTHHRKLDRWLQLGGHADGQWHVEEVALREAREESGFQEFDFVTIDGELIPLDVDVHLIPARYDSQGRYLEDAHEHHDVRFLLIARTSDAPHVSHESHDVAWFTPEEIYERTEEESVLRMLRKAFDLLG